MNFEHRGVKASLPDEMLSDVRYMGMDVPILLTNAIDRMLRVSGKETDDFQVAVQITNAICEEDQCAFQIKFYRFQ